MHAVTYRRSNSSPAVCPDPPDPRLRRNKKKKKKRQKTAPFKQKRFFYAKEKGDLSRQARDKHERKTQEIKRPVCVCVCVCVRSFLDLVSYHAVRSSPRTSGTGPGWGKAGRCTHQRHRLRCSWRRALRRPRRYRLRNTHGMAGCFLSVPHHYGCVSRACLGE